MQHLGKIALTARITELVLFFRIRLDFRLRALHVSGAFSRDLSQAIFFIARYIIVLANREAIESLSVRSVTSTPLFV